MTAEEKRREELEAIEQERRAFERRHKAFIAVHRQFYPLGNGSPTTESLRELDAAEDEWQAAKERIDQIVHEIRSGQRR